MIYGFVKSKLDGTEQIFSTSQKVPETFSYKLPKVLNQYDRPICVPCSISAFLNWDINIRTGDNEKDNKINLDKIYEHKTTDTQGMTFKDALNYLYKSKQIKMYALIKSPEALKTAILLNGPCVAALPVYNSNRYNFWTGETLEGYHAIALVGWNKDGFILRNSWGQSFGDKGYTIVPYDQFNKFYEIWTLIN